MPNPSYGYEEICYFGQEKTYGTLADGTGQGAFRAFRSVSFRLISDDPPMERRRPTGRPVGWLYNSTGPYEMKGLPKIRGEIVLECDFEDIGALLKVALNDDPTSAISAVSVCTSTFVVPIVPAAMVQSLSIVRKVGATFSGKDQQFLGCYIESLRLRFEPDAPVLATVTFVGRQMTFGTAPAATYSATPWMEYHEHAVSIAACSASPPAGGDLLASGNEPTITEFTITNGLRVQGGAGQGVRGIRKPIIVGKRIFQYRLERDWAEHGLLDAYYAEGAAGYRQVQIAVTSEDNIPSSSPAAKYSLTLLAPACRIVGDPPTFGGGYEITPQVLVWEAGYDAQYTSSILTATLVNGGSATEYADDV